MTVTPLLESLGAGIQDDTTNQILESILVLKVLRLFRLARALRLFAIFKDLWMLVRGLLSSGLTLFYSFVILLVIHYMFACLAVELLTKHKLTSTDSEWAAIVQEYFKDLYTSMLTLLQFTTFDSVAVIQRPMARKGGIEVALFF